MLSVPESAAKVTTLKRRAEFLRVRGGARWGTASFNLEAKPRASVPEQTGKGVAGGHGPRFGYTVTKQVGNAVVRNRIRRRLKEATRLIDLARLARSDCDYVIFAREAALRRPFHELQQDLRVALDRINRRLEPRDRRQALNQAQN